MMVVWLKSKGRKTLLCATDEAENLIEIFQYLSGFEPETPRQEFEKLITY